ncbi:pentapeptide repeat-containing protein [Bacillus sp. FJAT-42376]|uniref:pentapeptide repeat-containing protein n=1 Tax=Bacillus sp. FJAT-42376 TaxID=2014076 RepID=UPI000F4EF6A3|nr:pentapeptide repeat-containing protein [Bacillus sp. FJAT-42376]AZB41709.1 pentapeptide repeat-containing protein [Bacillus sp. FJAT-42376]
MSAKPLSQLQADCENCFGLCCVALPYAKSADFPIDKDGGTPCRNLQADYRCGIHQALREKGFKGCTVFECFGAGQKVSQVTYGGNDWRDHPDTAKEMFEVFPIMQQLHEMLGYLHEALNRKETESIYRDLQAALEQTAALTELDPESIISLNVPAHRSIVNELLIRTSELVRKNTARKKHKKLDYIGAKLKGANLKGASLRGALLIAADLRNADIRLADMIGADLRDADLSGADLRGSIFLTQVQVNSARGDGETKLPEGLNKPLHWFKK